MTGNRLLDLLIYILCAVLIVWLVFVIVDRIDDEDDPGYFDPSVYVAALE